MKLLENGIMVSVITTTFNQKEYISESILSVLNQNTNFNFELIVSDDHSTDGTGDVVKDIINKHPKGKLIKYIYQPVNLGYAKNHIETFCSLKGKYIAVLDGDDYWTDPHKLQKQVDFLESNLDYSLCCHLVASLTGEKLEHSNFLTRKNYTISLEDLSKGNSIPGLSILYRNNTIEIPDWIFKVDAVDYVINMLYAIKGKIYCLADEMAVYRKEVGFWSSQDDIKINESTIFVIETLVENLDVPDDIRNTLIEQIKKANDKILTSKYPILKSLEKQKRIKGNLKFYNDKLKSLSIKDLIKLNVLYLKNKF